MGKVKDFVNATVPNLDKTYALLLKRKQYAVDGLAVILKYICRHRIAMKNIVLDRASYQFTSHTYSTSGIHAAGTYHK